MKRNTTLPSAAAACAAVFTSLVAAGLTAQLPTFAGESKNQFRNVADPGLAVGNFIVQTVNSRIVVRDKSSTIPVWRENLNSPGIAAPASSLFGPLGGTRIVDTKVVYDRQAQRYGLVGLQIDNLATAPAGTPGIYVAWSKGQYPYPGSTASHGWWRYVTPQPSYASSVAGFINNPAAGIPNIQYRADYNGLGVTATQLIYSANLEPVTPGTWPNVQFYRVFSKASLDGGPPVYTDRFVFGRQTFEFAHAADDLDDSGTAAIFASVRDPAVANGYFVELNQVGVVAAETRVTVDAFILAAGSAPQGPNPLRPGYPNPPLNSGDGRVTQAVIRNGRIFLCHTVMVPFNTTGPRKNVVRWYDIDLNGWPTSGSLPTKVQQGNIELGNETGGERIHTYMGGISVNSHGVIAVTYTRSSSLRRPEMAMSSRLPCGLLGTMTHDGLGTSIHTSTVPFSGSAQTPERWADWATVAIDGTDPRVFWASTQVSEYEPTLQNIPRWGTRIHRRPLFNAQTGTASTWGSSYPTAGGPGISFSTAFPVVGSRPDIRVSHGAAPAGAAAMMILGLGQSLLGLPSNGLGGLFYVDLNAPHTSVFFNLSAGSVTDFPIELPPDPVWAGLDFYYQATIADPNSPTGVSFTKGLGIRVGC